MKTWTSSIFLVFLLAIIGAFVVEKDAGNNVKTIERRNAGYSWRCNNWPWWWPKWWSQRWGRRCCVMYNTETHYCAKKITQKCCLKDNIYEKPKCPPGGNPTPPTTYYPDMSNCLKYFQCYNGTLNHFSCPIGGAFQYDKTDKTSDCAFVRKIPPRLCGNRPFKKEGIPTVYVDVKILVVNGSDNTEYGSVSGLARQDSVFGVMSQFMANNGILDPPNSLFEFGSKFYNYFWYSIKTISVNGNPSTVPDNSYWKFYVNNQVSGVGVSSVLANDRDVFKFALTCWGGHD